MGEFTYSTNQRVKHAPVIRKLGIIGANMELTPIVLKGELLLVESMCDESGTSGSGNPWIRVRNPYTGKTGKPFGKGYYFASGYTENGTVYAFGTSARDNKPLTMYQSDDPSSWHDPRGGGEVRMFWSDDLETWNEKTAIKVPEWRLWNTSVCKGDSAYVMAIEVCQSGDAIDPVIGHPFTVFFAVSKNLTDWEMMPNECCYTRERYNACPALRYFDGWYYMICLEALPAVRYAPYIYRTKNFIDWEVGFHNPIMMYSDEDRKIKPGAPYQFTEEQIDKMENYININNSDIDLCEYEGKTRIFYATGNQQTYSFTGEAVYDGPIDQFCKVFF